MQWCIVFAKLCYYNVCIDIHTIEYVKVHYRYGTNLVTDMFSNISYTQNIYIDSYVQLVHA